jgi:hypothetical protein
MPLIARRANSIPLQAASLSFLARTMVEVPLRMSHAYDCPHSGKDTEKPVAQTHNRGAGVGLGKSVMFG